MRPSVTFVRRGADSMRSRSLLEDRRNRRFYRGWLVQTACSLRVCWRGKNGE